MITVEELTRIYYRGAQPVRALDGVSFRLAAGEFFSVMGPSGSGKSTLLNLLAGLDQPTAGEVVIDGQPLHRLSRTQMTVFRRRRIGLVFQFFNLLPTLTAWENVALPLLADGHSRRATRKQVDSALRAVDLHHRAEHHPDELSGGEMQRAAIARALVTDPPIILADEPTGNLDTVMGEAVLELLRRACDERGTTILLVTHDARAAAYGDRIVTIRDGRLETEVSRAQFRLAAVDGRHRRSP